MVPINLFYSVLLVKLAADDRGNHQGIYILFLYAKGVVPTCLLKIWVK